MISHPAVGQQSVPSRSDHFPHFSNLEAGLRALFVPGECHRLFTTKVDTPPGVVESVCMHNDVQAAAAACAKLIASNPELSIHFELNPTRFDGAATVGGDFTRDGELLELPFRRWKRVLFKFMPRLSTRECPFNDREASVHNHTAEVLNALQPCGWPLPIVAQTGDNVAAVFSIDGPVGEHGSELLLDLYRSVSQQFPSDEVKVDTMASRPDVAVCLYHGVTQHVIQLLHVPVQTPEIDFGELMEFDYRLWKLRKTADQTSDERPSRLEIGEVLELLSSVRRCGDGYVACCPAHADREPSLSVNEGHDGRILLHCHAGCRFEDICQSLNIMPWQLFSSGTSDQRTITPVAPAMPDANTELHRLAESCAQSTCDSDLSILAAQLGVSLSALRQLYVGWSSYHRAWSIPERRPDGWIVGVQLRAPSGQKWMITGSHRGLVLPYGWWDSTDRIYIPEGMTDVAALLSNGIPAIGRPSANGGINMLIELLRPTTLIPVVVGENDRKPDGHWPGRTGAEQCARELAAALQRPVEIKFPSLPHKDVRAMLNIHH